MWSIKSVNLWICLKHLILKILTVKKAYCLTLESVIIHKNLKKIKFLKKLEVLILSTTGNQLFCPVYPMSHLYSRIPTPKKLYTLEGKPPSVFVRRVLGEGLCTLTAFVQNSRRG
jgi:hypothetical protein